MNFKREKISNYYLHDTAVENVFINEFLPVAPGDFVRVYLFALMYAGIGVSINNESIAKQLSMPVEDVLKAWTFWEGKGVVRKHYPDPADKLHYKVEFLNLKEQIHGNGKAKSGKEKLPANLQGLMSDKELKKMYSRIEQITGRLLQGKEPVTILNWIRDYEMPPECIIFAYEYCSKNRNNCRLNYVGAVVKEWAGRGLKTVAGIEAHLQETDNRHYLYRRVMKALGFTRNPTEEEKRIMDTWFDDYNLDIDQVLEACKKTSGISNPNINYVNTVLTSKDKAGGGVQKESAGDSLIAMVMRSYEEDRQANEAAAEERRKEVYKAVPRIREIEEEIRKISMEISKLMLSRGEGAKAKIEELKRRTDALIGERSYLLTDNNFTINYLDVWYTCPKCKDMGILDSGARCPCFAVKLDEFGKKV
jgi:DnaD/phage-associated family protein